MFNKRQSFLNPKKSKRLFTAWIVAFVLALALPVPAVTQTLKPADLVGTWVVTHDGKDWGDSLKGKIIVDMLTLKADGSYTQELKKKDGDSLIDVWPKSKDQGNTQNKVWKLTGDTLRLGYSESNLFAYIVQLNGRRLVRWDWSIWNAGRHEEACAEAIFEHFDSPNQLTLPPPPQITINPADLVGTWAGTFDTDHWGTVNDTIIIGADYTLRSSHVGPSDNAFSKGTWSLLPGDILTGPLGNIDQVKVTLHDGKLVRCHYNYAILKRIAP